LSRISRVEFGVFFHIRRRSLLLARPTAARIKSKDRRLCPLEQASNSDSRPPKPPYHVVPSPPGLLPSVDCRHAAGISTHPILSSRSIPPGLVKLHELPNASSQPRWIRVERDAPSKRVGRIWRKLKRRQECSVGALWLCPERAYQPREQARQHVIPATTDLWKFRRSKHSRLPSSLPSLSQRSISHQRHASHSARRRTG
jgi:hypothetical protein